MNQRETTRANTTQAKIMPASCRRVVVVTGLSGGGKASVLRALEDVGYEAVDNPPLRMLEDVVTRSDRKLAVGVDARTRGFDPAEVLATLDRLRANPALRAELVYTTADEATLLRRYTETRRRHPLAPLSRVPDGIAAEQAITAALRDGADLVIDTTELSLAALRRLIERHYGSAADGDAGRMAVSLISFAYAKGLPREADLVFDARFLRNPHYDPILRQRTGLDPEVRAYIEADPDCEAFFRGIVGLIDLALPRFVQEGKKYATLTIGCTGGRHRSVYLIERLAAHLSERATAGRTTNRPASRRPMTNEQSANGQSAGGPAAKGRAAEGRAAEEQVTEEQATGGSDMSWRLHVIHRELSREDEFSHSEGAVQDSEAACGPPGRPARRRDASASHSQDRDGGLWPSPVQAQEA